MIAAAICAQTPPGGYGPSTGGSTTSNTIGSTAINGANYLNTTSAAGQIITDASWSNTSSTINSAGMAQWNSSIIGMQAWGTSGCRTGIATIDTIPVSLPLGTVLTVPSATQITVSSTTTAAVASAGCVFIGLLQDTQMAAITTAFNASTTVCPTVILPSGVFGISHVPGFLYQQSTGCANAALVQGQELGGTGGHLTIGQGANATVLVIFPAMLPSTECVHGLSNNACFFIPTDAQWRDFRITGMGNAMNGRADNTKFALESGVYVAVKDMVFDMWGDGDTGFYGWNVNNSGGIDYLQRNTVDGWGNLGVITGNGTEYVENMVVQNECGSSQWVNGGSTYSLGGFILQLPAPGTQCSAATNRSMMNITAGTYFSSTSDFMQNNGGATSSSTVLIGASGTFSMSGGLFVQQGASSFDVQNNGVFFLRGGLLNATGSTAILNQASGAIADVVSTGIVGTVTNSGTWHSSNSVGGALVVGNVGLTSGWGTSTVASVGADSNSHTGRFTITGAAGSASPTLTLTFPAAYYLAPPSCVLLFTGTNTGLTSVTSGTATKTNVVFTFVGTPQAVTYQFDYRCGP